MSEERKDYYGTLGVERDALAADIKSAFRHRCQACHPDPNQGDKDAAKRFTDIGEAYEVLKDPDKRRAYDLTDPEVRGKALQEAVESPLRLPTATTAVILTLLSDWMN